MVRREKRRPHPDLAQRRLRLHEEPRSESGEVERPGDQASHEGRNHLDCPETRFSTAFGRECECMNTPYFMSYTCHICFLIIVWSETITLSSMKKC